MVLRQALLGVSRNNTVRSAVGKAPISRDVVKRFVAGESNDDAVRVAGELAASGLLAR